MRSDLKIASDLKNKSAGASFFVGLFSRAFYRQWRSEIHWKNPPERIAKIIDVSVFDLMFSAYEVVTGAPHKGMPYVLCRWGLQGGGFRASCSLESHGCVLMSEHQWPSAIQGENQTPKSLTILVNQCPWKALHVESPRMGLPPRALQAALGGRPTSDSGGIRP